MEGDCPAVNRARKESALTLDSSKSLHSIFDWVITHKRFDTGLEAEIVARGEYGDGAKRGGRHASRGHAAVIPVIAHDPGRAPRGQQADTEGGQGLGPGVGTRARRAEQAREDQRQAGACEMANRRHDRAIVPRIRRATAGSMG